MTSLISSVAIDMQNLSCFAYFVFFITVNSLISVNKECALEVHCYFELLLTILKWTNSEILLNVIVAGVVEYYFMRNHLYLYSLK